MKNALEYIQLIDSTPGRNDKVSILIELINTWPRLTHKIFKVALDSQVCTFITKLPAPNENFPSNHQVDKFRYLDDVLDAIIHGRRFSKSEWLAISNTLHPIFTDMEMLYIRKILTKDLTIGASMSSFNKALKLSEHAQYLPALVEYDTLRVSNIEDAQIDPIGSYVSIKKDGSNATFYKQLISRNGNPIPLKHIEDAIECIKHTHVVFGELVSSDRQSSNGLVTSAIQLGYESSKAVTNLHFHVFDILPIEDYEHIYGIKYNPNYVPLEFHQRVELINTVCTQINHPLIVPIQQILINSLQEVYQIYDEAIEQNEEGIIWNDRTQIFEITRSTKRGRIKEVLDADFEIIDFNPHSKNPDWLGSFIFMSKCGNLSASTGSGLSDSQRADFWVRREDLRHCVIKVKYNKVIPHASIVDHYSVFLPVLDTNQIIRHDKPVADTLAEISWGGSSKAKQTYLDKIK